jgi:hypothetical protein
MLINTQKYPHILTIAWRDTTECSKTLYCGFVNLRFVGLLLVC